MEGKFKAIPGYEGYYLATESGKIFSIRKGDFMNPSFDKDGYKKYTFSVKGKSKTVRGNRIIATTFLENPLNLPQVNHISGIKTNDSVYNLEWISNLDNQRHSWKKLGRKGAWQGKGELLTGINNHAAKSIIQYNLQMNFVKEWETITDAANTLGINISNIVSVCKGKRKSAEGFIFKYTN